MVLFITGNVDVKETLDLIRRNQKGKKFSDLNPIKRFYPEEPREVKKTSIIKTMDVSKTLFTLGFKEKKC